MRRLVAVFLLPLFRGLADCGNKEMEMEMEILGTPMCVCFLIIDMFYELLWVLEGDGVYSCVKYKIQGSFGMWRSF